MKISKEWTILGVFVLAGCANPQQQLTQLEVGMTKDQVRSIMGQIRVTLTARLKCGNIEM